MSRNTALLQEIADVLFTELDEHAVALIRLEHHFRDRLLLDAGNVATVGEYAEQLRLHITADERAVVLDYIAQQKMVVINVDIVETAINDLLGWDRFIEPRREEVRVKTDFFLAELHSHRVVEEFTVGG